MRSLALNDSRKILKQWEEKVMGMNITHSWINPKDRFITLNLIQKAQFWLENTNEMQNNLTLTDDPILRVYEMSNVLEMVGANVTALKNIKPPKNYYEVLNLN